MNGFVDHVIQLDSGDRLSFQQTSGGLNVQVWRPTTGNGAGWLLAGSKLLDSEEAASLLRALQQPLQRSEPRQKKKVRRLKALPEIPPEPARG